MTNLFCLDSLLGGGYFSNLTQYNLTLEEYESLDFPEPWTDIDLSYPTDYNLEDDIAFLEKEEEEDQEAAEGEEEGELENNFDDIKELEAMADENEENIISLPDDGEEEEDGSGLLSLYNDMDNEAIAEEEEYYEDLDGDTSPVLNKIDHTSSAAGETEEEEELGG